MKSHDATEKKLSRMVLFNVSRYWLEKTHCNINVALKAANKIVVVAVYSEEW